MGIPGLQPLIDRSKIFGIINGNKSQSLTDWNTYAGKRGLNAANTLTFTFPNVFSLSYDSLFTSTYAPCTTPGYTSLNFWQAVQTFINNNSSTGVIVSTNTPATVPAYWNTGTTWSITANSLTCQVSLAAAAGIYTEIALASGPGFPPLYVPAIPYALYYVNGVLNETSTTNISWYSKVAPSWSTDTLKGYYSTSTALSSGYIYSSNATTAASHFIPFGRLGCPDYVNGGNSNTIIEATLTNVINSTTNISVQAATAALYSESRDNHRQLHLISDSESYVGALNFPTSCNQLMQKYLNNLGFNTANVSTNTSTQNISATNWWAGTTGTGIPVYNLFGYCIGSNQNNTGISPPSMACIGSMSTGTWGMNWQSASNGWAMGFLQAGAAGFVGTAGESYSLGNAYLPLLLYHLVGNRTSLMEAAFFCGTTGVSTSCWPIGALAHGDPLYSPYLSTIPKFIQTPSGLLNNGSTGIPWSY